LLYDDDTYYVETHEEAQHFLAESGTSLHKYVLSLNHKKTAILELPLTGTEAMDKKAKFLHPGNFI